MSVFTKALKAIGLGAPISKVRFPGRAFVFFGFTDETALDLSNEVGDGTSADVLMTPIRWLQRATVEAPIVAKDQEGEPIDPSDLFYHPVVHLPFSHHFLSFLILSISSQV